MGGIVKFIVYVPVGIFIASVVSISVFIVFKIADFTCDYIDDKWIEFKYYIREQRRK